MKPAYVNVYVGNWGAYEIPPEVIAAALSMTPEDRMQDHRTRGYKLVEAWGKQTDKKAN